MSDKPEKFRIERFHVDQELGEAFEDYANAHYRSVPNQLRHEMIEALVRWYRVQAQLRRKQKELETGEFDKRRKNKNVGEIEDESKWD